MQEFKFSLKHLILGILIGLVLVVSGVNSFPDNKLHVKVYDVGQGDAIFVKSPSGKTVLIDGGPDDKVLSLLGTDLPFYQNKLDLMVLSHPHADHVTGLVEVLKKYEVETVLANKTLHTSGVYENFLKLLLEKKINPVEPFPDKVIDLGDSVSLEIIWPRTQADIDFWQEKDLNQTSAVILLKYGKFSLLLPGDAGNPVWDELLREGLIPSVTVLKMPHHGSATGVSKEFLDVLKPESAIISVAKDNSYGLPAKRALSLLEEYGIKIYRTDQRGTIEIVSDGKEWMVN